MKKFLSVLTAIILLLSMFSGATVADDQIGTSIAAPTTVNNSTSIGIDDSTKKEQESPITISSDSVNNTGSTENNPEVSTYNSNQISVDNKKITPVVERTEVTSMRTDNCRYYQNTDGTMTAEIDLKTGSKTTSDNNLMEFSDSTSSYKNKSKRFQVEFPRHPSSKILDFTIQNSGLEMGLVDTMQVNQKANGKIDKNSINYANLLPSTDFNYKNLENGIKESIILKDSNSPDAFSFKLSTKQLKWLEQGSGKIDFQSSETGKTLFYISPVYAVDAMGNKIDSLKQTVNQGKDGLTLNIEIDKTKLANSVYPITIDPTITLCPDETQGMDTTLYPYNPTAPIYAGQSTDIVVDGYKKGLIKFDLSSIPRGTITGATMTLYAIGAGDAGYAYPCNAYQVTQEWLEDEANLSYAKYGVPWQQPFYKGPAIRGQTVELSNDLVFNMTLLVNAWVNGQAPNYGVLLTEPDAPITINSSNAGGYQPKLIITYLAGKTPPIASFTAPSKGSSVSGIVNISLNAQDPVGIQKVEFYANQALIGTQTCSPYTVAWDTSKFPNGNYKLWAQVYNNSGNYSYTNYCYAVDLLDDLSHVDPRTNAYWNQRYHWYEFANRNDTFISLPYTFSEPVKNAYLVVHPTYDGEPPLTCYISTDGGAHWDSIIPFTTKSFSPTTSITFKCVYYQNRIFTGYNIMCEKANDYIVTVNNTGVASPSGTLAATASTDGKINLAWGASPSNTVTYRVYRGNAAGFSATADNLLAGSINVLSYIDENGLTSGNTYYYKVTATVQGGTTESAPSNEASAIAGVQPPGSIILSAQPHSGSGINLTWTAGSGSPASYRIYRGTDATFIPASDNRVADNVTALNDNDTNGLISGNTYYYRVSPVTLSGQEGSFSNSAGAVNGATVTLTGCRTGIKSFWNYVGLPLARGQGMINVGTGNLAATYTDSLLTGNRLATEVRRIYNSLNKTNSPIGWGWSANILASLTINPDNSVAYNQGDGYNAVFTKNPDGTFNSPIGLYLSLSVNGDGTYAIRRKDNVTLYFSSDGRLISIKDLNNNTITYNYTQNQLTSITDTVGRTINIAYDASGHIISIKDPRTNPIVYNYDANGNLVCVTDPMQYKTVFSYDDNHNLTKVVSPEGIPETLNYDANGIISSITDGEGNTSKLSWNSSSGQTVLTDARNANTTFNTNPSFGNLLSEQDPLGQITTLTSDDNYNLLSISDPDGHTTSYTYDSMGNMLTRTNALGQNATVTYNSLNEPLTYTDENGGVTSYTYDAAGNLTQSMDPMNYSTSFVNDANGRRIKAVDPQGGTSSYTYDTSGNVSKITNALNKASSFTYDPMGCLTGVTDPLGLTTHYTYDDLGRLTRTDSPDGSYERILLDGDDRIVSKINANGGSTSYTYDGCSRVVSITDPMGYKSTMSYDAAGNRTRESDPEGIYTDYTYDKDNRMVTASDPLGNTYAYHYDSCGNMTEIVHPMGHSDFQTYDALNRKTCWGKREISGGSNENVTSCTYDSLGNVVSQTDPMGNTTTNQYNRDNKLTQVTLPLNCITSYTYDKCGRLISKTNANGHVTTYTYDKLGENLSECQPGGYTTQYTYDADGRLSSKRDPNNKTINYSYDSLSHMIGKMYPDIAGVTYTYDAMGHCLTMRDTLGISYYQYDKDGRLVEAIDCCHNKLDYTYYKNGQIKTLNPSFGSQAYEYDGAGRLNAETDFQGNRITFAYDGDGKTTNVSYPQGGTLTYTYNNLDQISNVNCNSSSTVNCTLAYKYDANGNVTEAIGNTSNNNLYKYFKYDHIYTYDQLNRLIKYLANYYNQYKETRYTYDNIGNILVKWNFDGTYHFDESDYTYDSADRMVSEKPVGVPGTSYTFTYDNNGNQIKTTATAQDGAITNYTYTYDYENNLTSRDYPGSYRGYKTNNYYNGAKQLVHTVNSIINPVSGTVVGGDSTYFQYDGSSQAIADRDGAGAVTASYSRTPTGKLISTNQFKCYLENNSVPVRDNFYIFPDQIGSTLYMYGKTTQCYGCFQYDDSGIMTQGVAGMRFTFTGAPYFSSIGLYQMGARFYDPSTRRFITRDTYRGNIYQPWTQNLYTYCNNNPINFIDPTGHAPTLDEAASIAKDVYTAKKGENALASGWALNDIYSKGGLQIGIYERKKSDGSMEYVLANKGTTPSSVSDWKNNLEQPSGNSPDMKNSIAYARQFVARNSGADITFVGHSKGGAEAAANAVATNENAMVFNPATVNLNAYNLDSSGYSGTMAAYIVRDDAVNDLEGWASQPIGSAVYLPQQSWNPITNHSIDSVITAINEWEADYR